MTDYTQIDVDYIRCTDKAILVKEPDHGEKWIPMSLIDVEDIIGFEDWGNGDSITIGVKTWFLEKEGLV